MRIWSVKLEQRPAVPVRSQTRREESNRAPRTLFPNLNQDRFASLERLADLNPQ